MKSRKAGSIALVLTVAGVANAAPIEWAPAFEIVTDNDIKLDRREVVYAVNGGDNTGNPARQNSGLSLPSVHTVTIGSRSIEFEGIEGTYGTASTFGQATFGDITTHLPGMFDNVTIGQTNERGTPFPQVDWDRSLASELGEVRIYTPLTGNAGLDFILASQVWSDGRTAGASATHLTLRNLVAGRQYQVQVIAGADSRPPRGSAIERSLVNLTLNDGEGNSVENVGAFRDIDGDGVKHVSSAVGKFVAGNDTQLVNVLLAAGRNPGFAAVIVSTYPQQLTVDVGVETLAKGGGTLELTSLIILQDAALDLRDNDMILNYEGNSPVSGVIAAWADGRLKADSDRDGLPTYLAIAEAADLGITEFNGKQVDESTLIAKFTYVGDANLDGQVDALDYERVDLAIGNTDVFGTAQGDLNYDLVVDALDYEQIDLNIGNGVGVPLAVAVPEPTALAFGVCALLLSTRRRRA